MSIILEQVENMLDSGSDSPATIDTPLGDAVVLHSMGGIEGLSRPFVYEADVVSQRSDIEPSELLGQSITVHVSTGDDDGDVRHWNGRVTGFQYIETSDDGDSRYRLTFRPWLWQLSLSADCRIFQEMTIPEIVTKVFQDRGFVDFEVSLSDDYDEKDYVVQYRETDLQFVSRLLEREGIYYFFRHEDGKHTLVLADSPTAHGPAEGCEQLEYAPADEHRDATTQYVRKWKSEAQLESAIYAQADFDFTKPQVQLFAQATTSDATAQATGLQVYDYPGGFDNFADADAYTRLRLEQARRDATRWVGESNARGFTVGATFDLVDHPRDDQNQKYLALSARYRVKGKDQRSTGDDEDPFTASFVAIEADVTFRPPLTAPKPIARGPQTAVVVGPAGSEIWTDQYGRVKVQFPWDRVGTSDENSSCWIRVTQSWAGGSFGAQFIPRIGHEVIVDFLEGDPDRPIITGCVYNGQNMPPFDLPNNQTRSGIRGQSTPGGGYGGGNEIHFEDAIGIEDLYTHAQGTQTTVVERSQSATIGGDRSVTVGGSETVTVAGSETVAIGAGRSTAVALADTLSVVGAATTTVGGDQSLTVAGSAQTTVAGSYDLVVSGSVSESIDGDVSRSVSGAVDVTTEGEQMQTFGADFTERHAGHRVVVVGGPLAKRSSLLHVEGSARTFAAASIESVAVEGLTLICGQSQIVIKPDSVTISSPKISFVTPDAEFAGKKFAVTATDSIELDGKTVTASSSGASVALDSNATVQGGKVQLKGGSGSSASNDDQDAKVTTLSLVDQDGKPLANQRIILRTGGEGGDERTVVLDATGSIDIPGTDPFDIIFPDLTDTQKS
jgi:type VI secretion system secreted protein VgrG